MSPLMLQEARELLGQWEDAQAGGTETEIDDAGEAMAEFLRALIGI